MDECLWWPLQVQAGRVSENKRNWFGPSGGESMCEGHVRALVLFRRGPWGLSEVWGVLNVTVEFSFEMFCLLLYKDRTTFWVEMWRISRLFSKFGVFNHVLEHPNYYQKVAALSVWNTTCAFFQNLSKYMCTFVHYVCGNKEQWWSLAFLESYTYCWL